MNLNEISSAGGAFYQQVEEYRREIDSLRARLKHSDSTADYLRKEKHMLARKYDEAERELTSAQTELLETKCKLADSEQLVSDLAIQVSLGQAHESVSESQARRISELETLNQAYARQRDNLIGVVERLRGKRAGYRDRFWEPGYRLLDSSEIVQAGDEVQLRHVPSLWGRASVSVGHPAGDFKGSYFRRKID